MKKQLAILTMVLFVLIAHASNAGDKAVDPKPTNYKEVISKIEYPKTSKQKGIEGKVIVSLKVDKYGKVINHRFDSYPCTDLRDAVKKVLTDLRFEPAKNSRGEEITGFIAIPINFKLDI